VLAQDKMEWKSGQELTASDFKAPRQESLGQVFHLSLGLEISLNIVTADTTKSFNNSFTNVFIRDESSIDWTDATKLRYATGMFDLNEWMTREIRKRIYENRGKIKTEGYQKFLDAVRIHFEKMSEQYDKETESGFNLEAQITWENRIAENLSLLSDYCKACEPGH
jgi:hypothetical protein